MDHYLTIYRKDYLWPNLPGSGPDGGGAGGAGADRGSASAELSKMTAEELAFYQACLQRTRPPDCRCPQYGSGGGGGGAVPPGKEGGWSRNESDFKTYDEIKKKKRKRRSLALTCPSKSRKGSTILKVARSPSCTSLLVKEKSKSNGHFLQVHPIRRPPASMRSGPDQLWTINRRSQAASVPTTVVCIPFVMPVSGLERHFNKVEIMGPLLDPKLYPVKVGASPETSSSRYDQPNAFLDKLQSKYPMLYSILQGEASPELKQRIDRDRNKSTYQVDFCESGPGAKFEGLQRAQDDSGSGPCAQPMRLPGDPCRVGPKTRMFTPRTISKQQSVSDPRATCETTSATPPLGKSEYQDGVSKLGGIIMRDKLHRNK